MANIKFSAFTQKVVTGNVDFLVGYTGADNVRISPAIFSDTYLPLAGGTMTGVVGVVVPDDFKWNFGTGSDLQIHHNATNSFVDQVGTGALYLRGDTLNITSYTGTESYLTMAVDGAVSIYDNNIVKFTTTATGVSVTGNIELTEDVKMASGKQIIWQSGNAAIKEGSVSSYSLSFNTWTGAALTSKMFITSAGNVGIGVTNPSSYWANANNLVVGGLGAVSGITIATDGNLTGSLIFADGTGAGDITRGGLQYDHSADDMIFRVDDAERMRIDSTGNVGIGTISPSRKLDVRDSSDSQSTVLAYNQGASFTGTVYEAITDRVANSAFNLMNLKASTVSKFLVRGDGNVGIGIDSVFDYGSSTLTNVQISNGDYAVLTQEATSSVANGGVWRNIVRSSGVYQIQTLNDLGTGEITALEINRSGTAITNVKFPEGDIGIGGTPASKLDVHAAAGDGIRISNTTSAAYNSDLIVNFNDVSTMQLRCLGTSILQAGNTGNTVLSTRTDKDIDIDPSGTGVINLKSNITITGAYTDQNGVRTFSQGGVMVNDTAYDIDITVDNDTGTGTVHHITAMMTHYSTIYGCVLDCYAYTRAGNVEVQTDLLNQSNAEAGGWTVSKPDTTTLRLTKSAGTYTGAGNYQVVVVTSTPT